MKRLLISTLSKDSFKANFVKVLVENSSIDYIKPCFFWKFDRVKSFFANLRNRLVLPKYRRNIYVIPSNGWLLLHDSLPYSYGGEIVPFLWDCWPGNIKKLINSLKVLNVRLCFVTSSEVSAIIQKQIPSIRAIHVPEAVDDRLFEKGKPLKDRSVDVWELGRPSMRYHLILEKYFASGQGVLIGRGIVDLYGTLANSKIVVSFPQCDTNPEIAGTIETLTERYWESMFSRCLILGRAPKELINLIGYNPVVDIDWDNAENQLTSILNNIETYQPLVDRNYEAAKKCGSWKQRCSIINGEIEKTFYNK